MSSHVEQIKEKLGIADVVGSYLTLEKAGANFKAKCPFHNEKSPSFFISPVRGSYYCFGCGAKGDVISFVQEFEGLDFMGALRVLAKRAGIELRRESTAVRTERERLYLVMEHATLYFQRALATRKDVKDYLAKRGLTDATVREWRLGFAPLEWRALSGYLKTKGIQDADMERVGLTKKSEKNQSDSYDRFRGRIMFPIFDSSGRVVAFSGRQFESDGTEAKYLNSPETQLFEKSKILYGYDRAKLDIRRQDFSLLVEGQMDLLMSHQAGFTNTVASSGTALTADQLEILRRLSRNLVIAYDGDAAGNAAGRRGFELALAAGFDVKIVVMPKGKDPADLVREDPTAFSSAIKNAQHIIDVELAKIVNEESDDRKRGVRIERELLPLLARLDSAIEKSHFISKIAHAAKIKESAVAEEVRKREKSSLHEGEGQGILPQARKVNSRKTSLERLILGIILWQKGLAESAIDQLDISEKLCNIVGKERYDILGTEAGTKDELIFEAEFSYGKSEKLKENIEELLTSLREEKIREELSEAMRALQKAERDKDTDAILRLLARCQELSLELTKLSNHPQK